VWRRLRLAPSWSCIVEIREVSFEPFVSFAPGRVCLFGEHQDYLGFPVIAAAIPLGCRLVVQPRTDGVWTLRTPRLGFEWGCHVAEVGVSVASERPGPAEFLTAGLAEAMKAGWDVRCGGDVLCHVDLPLQSGLSSSTALVVAWVQALARVAGVPLSPQALAMQAHQVEVTHFGAPGGHMDHVASALGGTHRIHGDWTVERLGGTGKGVWVVVDSGQPKDTLGHLTRCKSDRQALVNEHGGNWCAPEELESWGQLTERERALWRATWNNRELESRAAADWSSSEVVGWMSEHHAQLRDGLGLSTETMERLGKAARDAGAVGWKMVGSGGGGCGLAWVPEEWASDVHQAVRRAGAAASWTVREASGAWCAPWRKPVRPAVVLAAGKSSRMRNVEAMEALSLPTAQREMLARRPKAMLPVGGDGRPFLALLLERLASEGVDEVCVVLSAEDHESEALLKPWLPTGCVVDVTRQTIPQGQTKPQGTADAVQRGLEAHPEWQGSSVSVFNGDNLPPRGSVEALHQTEHGTVAFARDALGLPPERAQAFAVFETSAKGGVRLIEKPTEQEIEAVRDGKGEVWVSMNLFRMPHDALLNGCQQAPVNALRGERELPTAVMLAAERTGTTLQVLPFRGAFVDLTHPGDWQDLTTQPSSP
jgi:galactokinase